MVVVDVEVGGNGGPATPEPVTAESAHFFVLGSHVIGNSSLYAHCHTSVQQAPTGRLFALSIFVQVELSEPPSIHVVGLLTQSVVRKPRHVNVVWSQIGDAQKLFWLQQDPSGNMDRP